ncbi:hypothetical protein OFB58_26625, partial [Escherichia coli]|nr:hypothetical protein [Escherichia coli]
WRHVKKGSASQFQPRRLVHNCYLGPVGVKAFSKKREERAARNLGGCTSDALLKNAIDARRGFAKPIKRDITKKKKEKQKYTKEKSYKGS